MKKIIYYFINNNNFEKIINDILFNIRSKNGKDLENYLLNSEFRYLFNLSEDKKEIIKKITFSPIEIDSDCCCPFMIDKKKYNIIYYVEDREFVYPVYRRGKVINELNKKFSVLTVNDNNFIEHYFQGDRTLKEVLIEDKPLVIIDSPNLEGKRKAYSYFKQFTDRIVYDKYDEGEEKITAEQVGKLPVICSSKNIYNNLPEDINKYYIPNGCTVKEVYTDKYETKTAIYVGHNMAKVDFNSIALLKAINPEWNIEVVGFENEEMKKNTAEMYPELILKDWMSEEELHKEICKCHIGLCLLEIDDITLGQLSDKFFNYVNAHIPTLIHEEQLPNYEDYKDFVIPLDYGELSLDTMLENHKTLSEKYDELLAKCDWSKRTEQIIDVIKKNNLI
jgi:hypothetical protein